MDPYLDPWTGRNAPSRSTPDPYWEVIRYAMGDTRTYANKLDLEKVVPSAALSRLVTASPIPEGSISCTSPGRAYSP